MDPERVPARLQTEITSPAHGVVEDRSGTIQADPFEPSQSSHPDVPNIPRMTARIDASNLNLNPSAANVLSSTSSEKSEHIQSPLPVRLPESNSGRRETRIGNDNRFSSAITPIHNGHSAIDWIVPTEEKAVQHTVGERLQPTLDIAITEKDRYTAKARLTGYALNIAIGLQVLLGSLTTGLSALALSGGSAKSVAASTTALGALSTLVASYLARARGSNEPELSLTRSKDLDQFIRECRAFQMDHGHTIGNAFDNELIGFRRRFEELLGNANGHFVLSNVSTGIYPINQFPSLHSSYNDRDSEPSLELLIRLLPNPLPSSSTKPMRVHFHRQIQKQTKKHLNRLGKDNDFHTTVRHRTINIRIRVTPHGIHFISRYLCLIVAISPLNDKESVNR